MSKFVLPKNEEKTILKTIRLKFSTLQKIEELATNSNLSINRVINECIEFALENLTEENKKS